MLDLVLVLLILLGVVAIIDALFKTVPSVFLTSILLATLLVHFYNFEVGLISLAFGVMAFIFAHLLFEFDFIKGLADIKFLVIIGLMIQTVQMFFAFMLITALFGMAYKLAFVYILKYKQKDEIPFLPCLFVVYVTLFLIGGVA